jgi:hypothetical protein
MKKTIVGKNVILDVLGIDPSPSPHSPSHWAQAIGPTDGYLPYSFQLIRGRRSMYIINGLKQGIRLYSRLLWQAPTLHVLAALLFTVALQASAAENQPAEIPTEDQSVQTAPAATAVDTPTYVTQPIDAPAKDSSPPLTTDAASAADLGLSAEEGTGNKLDWNFGGTIQTDLRFRAQEKSTGKNFYIGKEYYQRVLSTGVERNQNLLNVKFNATYGRYTGVVNMDFVWLGYSGQFHDLAGLSDITQVDPFYLKIHSLYFEANDFLIKGLDLCVGQQTILWGKGDQFNPTNNINPNDLEDVLLFGSQLGNIMVRADYTPISEWTISGVLVPIFKPALLPRSASLGLAAIDRMPMLDNNLRDQIRVQQKFAEGIYGPTVVTGVDPVTPDRSFENMQFEFRLAGTIYKQDIALSYYRGFSDMPVPYKNYTAQKADQTCQGDIDVNMCQDNALATTVSLTYPRMEVFGINMAGEVNPLGWISKKINPLGYRLEVAVVLPERRDLALYQDIPEYRSITGKVEYKYPDGRRPVIIKSTPFLKWVVGLDYTFSDHFYVNMMWVHGLTDEFGAGDFLNSGFIVRKGGVSGAATSDEIAACAMSTIGTSNKCANKYTVEILRQRIGDYVVVGLDFKFADDKALVRLFNILEVTGYYKEYWSGGENGKRVRKYLSPFQEGFSAIVYPEFNYNFGNGLDLGFGALLQLGLNFTKFGDPAAGGSLIWTRGRYRF